jgi:hypothetical protein
MRKGTTMKKYIAAFALLLGLVAPVLAQWQVPDHAVPIGNGAGVTGFSSVGPCAANTVVGGTGASTDPTCQSLGTVAGNQSANTVFAGPPSGGAAAPAFRAVVAADLPPGMLTNTLLSKTANYTLATGDCGSTLTLGGAAFYTLTVNAASGYPSTCAVLVVNTDTGRGKKMAVNGTTVGHEDMLWPLQSFALLNVNNVWRVVNGPAHRWDLRANISMFVDVTNGNNGNDGLAAGSGNAFATIQRAVDTIINHLDLSGQSVTVSVAAGNYPENIVLGNYIGARASFGFKQVLIRATDATCANTKINPTSGIGIFSTGNNPPITFEGFQIESPGNSVQLVNMDSGGLVALKAICFGATTNAHMVSIFNGSRIAIIESNYSVVGGGSVHEDAAYGASIYHQAGLTATLTGTPAFAIWARALNGANIFTNGTTYSGSASAGTQRYSASVNGTIDTGNNNALPGGTAGQVYSGGVYNGLLNASQQGIANHPVTTTIGAAPVASTCGTGPGTNGTDAAGFVTTGTGATACTITFNQQWVNAPQCIVQKLNTASTLTYSTSNTAITISAASASASYQWMCQGFPGG